MYKKNKIREDKILSLRIFYILFDCNAGLAGYRQILRVAAWPERVVARTM